MILIPWRKIRRVSAGFLIVALLGCFLLIGLELSEFRLKLRPVKQKRTQPASGRLSALLNLQEKQQKGVLINTNSKRPADINLEPGSHVLGLETRSLQAKSDWSSSKGAERGTRLPFELPFSPSAAKIRTSKSVQLQSPSVAHLDTSISKSRPKVMEENGVEIAAVSLATDTRVLATLESEGFEQHRETELQDIFISVKTTNQFHHTRVVELLQTWVGLAKSQVLYRWLCIPI